MFYTAIFVLPTVVKGFAVQGIRYETDPKRVSFGRSNKGLVGYFFFDKKLDLLKTVNLFFFFFNI